MAGHVEDFRTAITAQQLSSILTHATPVLVRVVFLSYSGLAIGVSGAPLLTTI